RRCIDSSGLLLAALVTTFAILAAALALLALGSRFCFAAFVAAFAVLLGALAFFFVAYGCGVGLLLAAFVAAFAILLAAFAGTGLRFGFVVHENPRRDQKQHMLGFGAVAGFLEEPVEIRNPAQDRRAGFPAAFMLLLTAINKHALAAWNALADVHIQMIHARL